MDDVNRSIFFSVAIMRELSTRFHYIIAGIRRANKCINSAFDYRKFLIYCVGMGDTSPHSAKVKPVCVGIARSCDTISYVSRCAWFKYFFFVALLDNKLNYFKYFANFSMTQIDFCISFSGYYQPAGPLINVPHGHTQSAPLGKSGPLSETSSVSPPPTQPPPAPSSAGDSSDNDVSLLSL